MDKFQNELGKKKMGDKKFKKKNQGILN